jgi:hypothetical protein
MGSHGPLLPSLSLAETSSTDYALSCASHLLGGRLRFIRRESGVGSREWERG